MNISDAQFCSVPLVILGFACALSFSPSLRFITSIYFAHPYCSFTFNRNIISFTSHRTDINMFSLLFLFVVASLHNEYTHRTTQNSLQCSATLTKNYRKNSINNCVRCARIGIDMTKCKINVKHQCVYTHCGGMQELKWLSTDEIFTEFNSGAALDCYKILKNIIENFRIRMGKKL